MEISDFKIGEYFWTGAGKWLCLDVGTVSVVAIRAMPQTVNMVAYSSGGKNKENFSQTYSWKEILQDPWYKGKLVVIEPIDLPGCVVYDAWEGKNNPLWTERKELSSDEHN